MASPVGIRRPNSTRAPTSTDRVHDMASDAFGARRPGEVENVGDPWQIHARYRRVTVGSCGQSPLGFGRRTVPIGYTATRRFLRASLERRKTTK